MATALDLGNVMGNRWYTGTAVAHDEEYPETAVTGAAGYLGDMYLNTDTGNVYQCTAAGDASHSAWTYKGCIKSGVPGEDGADGSTLLNGGGDPDDAEGNDGDYYLDTSYGRLYQKDSGTWEEVATFNIAGASVDSLLSEESENPVQNKVITKALGLKQDSLEFDATPTAGSLNPVTSNGVYDAINKTIRAYEGDISMASQGNSSTQYPGERRVRLRGRTVYLSITNIPNGEWFRKFSAHLTTVGSIPAGWRPATLQYASGFVRVRANNGNPLYAQTTDKFLCNFWIVPHGGATILDASREAGAILLDKHAYNADTLAIIGPSSKTPYRITSVELTHVYEVHPDEADHD